jgi:hypothetical protein
LQVVQIEEYVLIALVRCKVVDHRGLWMRTSSLQEASAPLAFEGVTQQRDLTQISPLLRLIKPAIFCGFWRSPLIHC